MTLRRAWAARFEAAAEQILRENDKQLSCCQQVAKLLSWSYSGQSMASCIDAFVQ